MSRVITKDMFSDKKGAVALSYSGPKITRGYNEFDSKTGRLKRTKIEVEVFDRDYVSLVTKAEPEMLTDGLDKLPKSELTGFGRWLREQRRIEIINKIKLIPNIVLSYFKWLFSSKLYRTPISYHKIYGDKYIKLSNQDRINLQHAKGIHKILFRRADGIFLGKFLSDDPDNLRMFINCWNKEISQELWKVTLRVKSNDNLVGENQGSQKETN